MPGDGRFRPRASAARRAITSYSGPASYNEKQFERSVFSVVYPSLPLNLRTPVKSCATVRLAWGATRRVPGFFLPPK